MVTESTTSLTATVMIETTLIDSTFQTTEVEVMQSSFTETSMLVTELISPSTGGDADVPFSTYVLAVFVASLMFLVTVVPNIVIIMLVIVDRKLRRLSNYYIISLAVADCIVGAVVMPCMASYTILGFWALGGLICDLWITFDFMCCTTSMLSLCMISLDRYWAITQPLKHLGRQSRRRAMVYVASIWIISAICWVPAIIAFRIASGDFGEYDCVYLTDPIYVLVSAVAIYYAPMFAMVYLYANVYVSVKNQFKSLVAFEDKSGDATQMQQDDKGHAESSDLSNTTIISTATSVASPDKPSVYRNRGFSGSMLSLHEPANDESVFPDADLNDVINTNSIDVGIRGPNNSTLHPTPVNSVSQSVAENHETTVTAKEMKKLRMRKTRLKHAAMNRRTARTLGIIVILFLVCWLPFAVLFPINAFCDCIPGKLYDASYWLAYLNSTLNPFLYGFSLDFRRAFRRLFCKRCMSVAQDMSSVDDVK